MVIIGVSGNNGAGKDTFSAMLKNALAHKGKKVETVAFADVLYDVCHHLFYTYPKDVCDSSPALKEQVLKHLGKSTRQVLIEFAQFSRQLYPNILVNHVTDNISHDSDFVIFTDVRFENEMEETECMFQIQRLGCTDNIGKCWGIMVRNNDTLDDLQCEAEEMADMLLQKDAEE